MNKLAATLLLLLAAPANAAVLTYNYTGNPLVCPSVCVVPVSTVPFTGQITIDEALLASGSVANQTFSWFWLSGAPANPQGVLSVSYGQIFSPYAVATGGFGFSFDAAGQPLHWSGHASLGAWVIDPGTNDGIDRIGEWQSLTAGVWTGGPAPQVTAVPLPAGFPLFAAGLFVISIFFRRRA